MLLRRLPLGLIPETHHGPGPFITHGLVRRVDGELVAWESRAYRKHHNRLDTRRGSTWWAPGAIGWWIGVLFAVGAACFAVGPIPAYARAVGETADAWTYFIGSLFFTSAGFCQYLEVVNTLAPDGSPPTGRIRLVTWEPDRIDWWATSIQFVGTVLFNVSTFSATRTLPAFRADQVVWRPDVYGSVCFLIASGLAWAEVGGSWIAFRPRRLDWWIAALNLIGSIAFGISAVGAHIGIRTGTMFDAFAANAGTFVGAICFLVGAVLLLPERTAAEPAADPALAAAPRGGDDGGAVAGA